jgi:hypothetical protein
MWVFSLRTFCEASPRSQKPGTSVFCSNSSMRIFNLGRSKMPPEVLAPAGEFL